MQQSGSKISFKIINKSTIIINLIEIKIFQNYKNFNFKTHKNLNLIFCIHYLNSIKVNKNRFYFEDFGFKPFLRGS